MTQCGNIHFFACDKNKEHTAADDMNLLVLEQACMAIMGVGVRKWKIFVRYLYILGVKDRNRKMDFKTGGTWRQVGQYTNT